MSNSLKDPLIVSQEKQVSRTSLLKPISFSEILEQAIVPPCTSVALQGHLNSVNSVRVSPDCQLIASGSLDFTIKLWSLDTLTELSTLKGHSDEVWSVTFFHSNTHLASASKDSTIIVWNLLKFEPEFMLTGHEGGVQTIIVSKDDKFILSGSDDCRLKVWNLAEKKLEFELTSHSDSIKTLALSHNGEFIASGSSDRTIRLWDFYENIEVFVLNCSGEVNTLVILPGDGHLVSGTDDGKIVIWSLETRTEEFVYCGHSEPVYSISLSDDGKTLVTGSADLLIKVIDLEKRVEKFTLASNADAINSLQISPNNKFIVTGSADHLVKIWSLERRLEQATLDAKNGRINALALSSNSHFLLAASDESEIVAWNLNTFQEEFRLCGHLGSVTCILLTKDGKYAMSGSTDEQVKIWNLTEKNEEFSFTDHKSEIVSLALSHNNQFLAASGEDLTIILWNMRKKEKVWELSNSGNKTPSLMFSTNDFFLFSANEEHRIQAFNTTTSKLEYSLSGHLSLILAIAVVNTGKLLITSDQEGLIKVWNILERKEEYTLKGHAGPASSLDVLKNGKWLVSGSSDKSIKIWDIEEKRVEFMFNSLADDINAIKFSDIGDKVFAGCSDGCIKVWGIGEKNEEFALFGHSAGIKDLALAPDDQYCVSVSLDNTVKVWNLLEKTEDCTLGEHLAPVTKVSFSPNGEYLATASLDSSVKLWNFIERSEISSFECIAPCTALCFSKDSHTLMYACDTNKVKIYDFNDSNIRMTCEINELQVLAIDFSLNGNFLLTAGKEGYVKVWRFPGFSKEFKLNCKGTVLDAKFGPNGQFIASLGEECIQIWNFFNRTEEFSLSLESGTLNSINFSPDGKYLITGGNDCVIRIWNLKEKREEFSFKSHTKSVQNVKSMNNGRFLLSVGEDGAVRGWKMQKKNFSATSVNSSSTNEYYKLNLSKFNTLEVHKSKNSEQESRVRLTNLAPNKISMNIKGDDQDFVLQGNNYYLGPVLTELIKLATSRNLSTVFKKSSNLNNIIWGPDSVLDPYFNPKALFYNFLHCIQLQNFSDFNSQGITITFSPFLYTPAHIWANFGNAKEIQRFLLKNKAFVLKTDVFGRSPIHYSIHNRHQDCTDTLINCILCVKQSSSTLIATLYAIRKDFVEILQNSSQFLPALIDKVLLQGNFKSIKKVGIYPQYRISEFINPDINETSALENKEVSKAQYMYLPFKLHCLPYSTENIEFLEKIRSCEDRKVFDRLLIKALINYNWEASNAWAGFYALSLLMNIITFLLVFHFSATDYVTIILYSAVIILLFIWEILKITSLGIYEYCMNTWNLFDLLKFPLSIYWIFVLINETNNEYVSITLAFIILATSLRSFKLCDSTRNYLNLFCFCLTKLESFLFLFFYSTFCFSVLFIVSHNEALSFESLWSETWSFNFSPLLKSDEKLGNFWIKYSVGFIATVINVIFLMNLLISILSDCFKEFQIDRVYLDYMEKLRLSIEIQKIVFWKRTENDLKYFHIMVSPCNLVEKREGQVKFVEEISGKGMENENNAKVKKNKKEVESKIQEVKEKVAGLEEKFNYVQVKIEGIEENMKKILEALVKIKN